MNRIATELAKGVTLLGGLAALARLGVGIWPRENQFRFDLPSGVEVKALRVEVHDAQGEAQSVAELHPRPSNAKRIEYRVRLPPGDYRVIAQYEIRSADELDKNHGGDWTRVGVQHQIHLEGEDHHFPPPDHEAQ